MTGVRQAAALGTSNVIAFDNGATVTGSTSTITWQSWITSASTLTSGQAWIVWNHAITGTGCNTWTTIDNVIRAHEEHARAWITWVRAADETHEQRAERTRRAAEAARLAEAARQQREAAKQRARKLLVACLDERQRKTYAERGFFYVLTKSGKCYRIDQGTHGNVKLVEERGRRVLGSYCIQPDGVPDEDAMLAQKLHLEADEPGFLRIANFRAAA